MSRLLRGSCLCGKAVYEVADEFEYSLICHCSNCRKATGSAFKPFAGIVKDAVSIVSDEESTMIYGDDVAHDVHCRLCGSLMFSIVREGAYAHVTLGTLEDDPAIRPAAHIFVASKAPWYEIRDDLPQHDELP